MAKKSAGLIMYRINNHTLEVLLMHPGGPFWSKKDLGAWTIPKGEYEPDEEPLQAAGREFTEETGLEPRGSFIALTPVRQRGGKLVSAWAFGGDCDPGSLRSNTFTMEWPPRSGKMAEFPEIDRAAWYTIEEAQKRILPAQLPFLEELNAILQAACFPSK
jgi:predicted NUDIX family NTP pyrophosphohydrolase